MRNASLNITETLWHSTETFLKTEDNEQTSVEFCVGILGVQELEKLVASYWQWRFCSLDLSACEFYLCGNVKQKVYRNNLCIL
jgi:hypothetical protein